MSESLAVVCYQWNNGFRKYLPDYVNRLAKRYRQHLPLPHRFVCITDETQGFSADVELLPLPEGAREVAKLRSPEGDRFPASYRRLWTLSDEARSIADRILVSDIDALIVGPCAPLIDVDADFVGWRPRFAWGTAHRVGGGSWLVRTGRFGKLWRRLLENPQREIRAARAAGFRGSDQALLSFWMRGCIVWPKDCGIYQSQDLKKSRFERKPDDARIVHFNGKYKPWDSRMQRIPWIRRAF